MLMIIDTRRRRERKARKQQRKLLCRLIHYGIKKKTGRRKKQAGYESFN